MTSDQDYLPFSQRTGRSAVPPQLKLGEASNDLRRYIAYYIGLEIEREQIPGYQRAYFEGKWARFAIDFHVIFLKEDPETYQNNPYEMKEGLREAIKTVDIGTLFDLVEFFIRHPSCSKELKADLAGAFVSARAAYRIVDGQIIAIGVEEQAVAFEKALSDAEAKGAEAARAHLVAAGKSLRSSDWAGCIRESIHAVEAMARHLEPASTTLGPALNALERRGHLHGSLKAAFGALYGYASDEEGVRHALVLQQAAKVDEADALFMLGACASFVSYLIARGR